MLTPMLDNSTDAKATRLTQDRADELVRRLNADPDDDWTYAAEKIVGEWYRVAAFDDEGYRVGCL